MYSSWKTPTSHTTPVDERRRSGMVVVMFSLLLVALFGMLGLVIDTGYLLATHRQAQNAADAAALAAAVERINGFSEAKAEAVAAKFVKVHNGLADATGPFLTFPPTQGAYAGDPGAVEAVVTTPTNTFFIHILGAAQTQNITARAVAVWDETQTSGAGVIVLDPDARPGLDVSGGGRLIVEGLVYDNSEGGGYDENGNPIDNGENGFAARAGQPNSATGIYTTGTRIVGGVDDPANFKPFFEGEPNNLKTGVMPAPDPLLNLATPTLANGVRNVVHDSVTVANNGTSLKNFPDPSGENTYDEVTGKTTLYPGLYDYIEITGGDVLFHPGIYVVRAGKTNALKINGGIVVAEGIMFYNTGDNYDASTGWPDNTDGGQFPPFSDGARTGGVTLNAGMRMSPIDSTNPAFDYSGQPGIGVFDGMLFYQRRRNTEIAQIQGDSSSGLLTGTIYAKWALFKISGQGTYDAQFVIGSLAVPGQGDVELTYGGKKLGKAPAVFLVE